MVVRRMGDGIDKYPELRELLQGTGHFVAGEEAIPGRSWYAYRSVPFSPEAIVGLAVHSLLSGRRRSNFYTDGKRIFYEGNGNNGSGLTPSQKEDVVREDLVLDILDAAPHDVGTGYETYNGHARVADFSSAFSGRAASGSYIDYLKGEVPYGLVREDETRNIRRRVQREHDDIARLLAALRADVSPLPQFADRLEAALARYGYGSGPEEE